MARGPRKFRTGNETTSTFEKTPAVDLAILDLQRHYVTTGRAKPSMRDLLVEGLSMLLVREQLPAMPEQQQAAAPVIQINKKTTA